MKTIKTLPLTQHTLLKTTLISLFTLIIGLYNSFGQKITTQADFQINIKKALQPLKIDGDLSDADWQTAAVATNFQVHFPQNGAKPAFQTEARLTYDDHFLYIGFTCYDTGKFVVQTLKRDVNYFSSDAVAVALDPIGQQTNGFLFGVNTEGVQADALLGGERPSFEWDNKWYAEVKKAADRWTVEMAIPFKTLRYDASKTAWNINFIRNDFKSGSYQTWTKIPQGFFGISIAHTGTLNWDKAPPFEKSNIALIPYASGSVSKDYQNSKNVLARDVATEGRANSGLDAKVALSSSLNLDATINPDFSQVEADEQVTNLTRFNIFYPEKRTFFLENSDVFNEFGIPPMRPFFSRSIGLNSDGQAVPIYYGLRLSGNVLPKTRINAFNMHTKGSATHEGQNFSALAVQQNLFGRSYIKIGFLNRQGFQKFETNKADFGRNVMAALVLRSRDSRIEYWLEGFNSYKPHIDSKNNMFGTGILWTSKNGYWNFINDTRTVGTNFYADMGFINRINNYDAVRDTTVRLGYTSNFSQIEFRISPKFGKVTNQSVQFENFRVWNLDGSFNELFDNLTYNVTFKNTSLLSFKLKNSVVKLPFPFKFSNENALLKAEKYHYTAGSLGFQSDMRKPLSASLELGTGQFYNGNISTVAGGLRYRIQPWGSFSVKAEYNSILLPALQGFDGITSILLVSPKTEINFSRNLSWTTWFQYNTQANNMNINSRLQWRYKPMSDLFLVYTDNYFAKDEIIDLKHFTAFQPKQRALVFKMAYWLNL
jgi:Domain of unknown function (DUF5916)/Carbohydrate family 9 binding domain-like